MLDPATILLLVTLSLAALGILEFWSHRQSLAKIPYRIHVNGTRGKSSVTRLIAAGLRSGGLPTMAKTTGTLPRIIDTDGDEFPITRHGRPNIIEQVHIISLARRHRVKALVIECMALQPYLQWLTETKLVRATHGVVTNAREDHLDVMGPTESDVARALAGTTPSGGTLFTCEQRNIEIFEQAAQDRESRMIQVSSEEVRIASSEAMGGFRYIEHAENVALALKVCESLGVDRQKALEGMWRAEPDPGALTEHTLDFFGRTIHFVNGFAANDPESTQKIWNLCLARHPETEKTKIALFNCRADRADRSRQLGEAYARWRKADRLVLMGSGTFIFAQRVKKLGVHPSQITFLDQADVAEVFETLVELSGKHALIVGMGNIGGQGLELARYFRNRSVSGAYL